MKARGFFFYPETALAAYVSFRYSLYIRLTKRLGALALARYPLSCRVVTKRKLRLAARGLRNV